MKFTHVYPTGATHRCSSSSADQGRRDGPANHRHEFGQIPCRTTGTVFGLAEIGQGIDKPLLVFRLLLYYLLLLAIFKPLAVHSKNKPPMVHCGTTIYSTLQLLSCRTHGQGPPGSWPRVACGPEFCTLFFPRRVSRHPAFTGCDVIY